MRMTGSEEKLFGLVLSMCGLSYQDTEQGILIFDSDGKPYQDKRGRVCFFEKTSDAIDAIDWIFNVRETPYRLFQSSISNYVQCKETQTECDEYEWWTKGEWYQCIQDGNKCYIETNHGVWKDLDIGVSENQTYFHRIFDVYTKAEYNELSQRSAMNWDEELSLSDRL